MTTYRPMPEPPECTCMSRGNGCSTCLDAIGWDPEEDCPSCPVHVGPSYDEDKRLTYEGCAAEYWRAHLNYESEHLAQVSQRLRNLERAVFDDLPQASVAYSETRVQARREMKTWHRFATYPHALEVKP